MNLLSWNCRELGNLRTVQNLHQLVKDKKPDVVFLMETICTTKFMEGLRVQLGFSGLFVVDPVGRSGGLALLWKDTVNIEIFNFSRHHINDVVHEGDDNFRWKLTGLYGQPDTAGRGETWALLSHLKSFQPTPWLCVGDFNEILDQSERDGAVLRQESLTEHFWDTLEFCGLCDLGYVELRFTWCNNRSGDFFTRERLDRAVANQEWCSRFLHVIVSVLAAVNSDHHPILVAVRGELNDSRNYMRRGGKMMLSSWIPFGLLGRMKLMGVSLCWMCRID